MIAETTTIEIALPSFGSSVGTATLVAWHTTEGAAVAAGQTIADIETDKAITELEAPASGVIEQILVSEGSEDIDAGTVLALLRVAAALPPAAPRPDSTAADDVEPVPAVRTSKIELPAEPQATSMPGTRIPASPYARTLARQRQIALEDVAGSGPNGRIVSRDVPLAKAEKPAAAALTDAGHVPGTYMLEPVSRMRRAIAKGLMRSVREIPAYSLEVHIDLDDALDFRLALNKVADEAARTSLNDIVVQACARALLEVPAVNSAWTDEGIVRFRHANIAIAVATDTGLVAPVIRAAERLTLQEVSAVSRDYIRRAQEGRLRSEELPGATFTVSNLGMHGIRAFNSIPGVLQGAILSVGAAEPRPVVRDGSIVIATQASFTLTCDHRVIDGAVGARFLDRLRENLSAP